MSTSDKICNVTPSSKSNDDVCDANNMLKVKDMSMVDKDNSVSVCANCGKAGSSDNMNTCNKCKQVKYCNAVCKKVHKKKHKKDCEEYQRLAAERRSDELRRAAELHDKELFKQPPPADDCPICFLRIPSLETGWKYKTCCGKVICSGCIHAPLYDNQGNEVDNQKCPFCRVPKPTSNDEIRERLKKRVEAGDAMAMLNHGNSYFGGLNGYSQDYNKALELWHRAGELGLTDAYYCIGITYERGDGVEVDNKKAMQYYDLAAIGGCVGARHNLGINEIKGDDMDRALKHWMIAVRSGCSRSLEAIKQFYSSGHATKEDYTNALQSYQAYLGEIKRSLWISFVTTDGFYT